ncbi:D-alanyl-D-alanine carboxypeptidase family protein [Pueribacillus sp. YX66]|uniref:D-alanyl-D-alanine carboxypeptidase family protein n=1 Tax=Pueribacillus sp. YX66 TaxID=3229242 RepID=UPI00358D86BE
MKKVILSYVVIILLFINGNLAKAELNWSDVISADAWVVMDSDTGEILLEKNKNEAHFPASITKIVTAIIAIEESELDEVVTVSRQAVATEGSSLTLKEGDQIHLKDLLYGIMLHSGNDGAVAVAEHISQTENEFAQKMTSFARSIGAKNTNFVNASGLPNDLHYTTAYDMAIITRYAMKNPVFKKIVGHKTYKWDKHLWNSELESHEKEEAKKLGLPWTGEPQIINHNRLLTSYGGATGVKNGFTHKARYTVVGAAERNQTELIAVIFRSDNVDTAFQDMKKLLDEGFSLSMKKNQKESNNDVIDEEKQQADLFTKQINEDRPFKQSSENQSFTPNLKQILFYLVVLAVMLITTVSFLINMISK